MKEGFRYAHAREIARVTLLQELRRPRGAARRGGKLGGILASFLIYLIAGLLSATTLAQGVDPFSLEVFSTSAFMLLVAVFMIMEFSTIVTGSEDLAFYVPLPVSPRSYVAAKMAVTCVFAVGLALVYAIPSVVILPLSGRPAAVLAVHVFSLVSGGLISCLAVTALMGLAVRFVSYKRVREVAAWVQMVLFIGVYGGFTIFQRVLSGAGSSAGIELTPLLMLAPSAWAPSILRLGQGPLASIGLSLALGAPCVLFIAALRVISHAYGGKLTESNAYAPSAKTRGKAMGGRSFLWRSPEEKGISLLIRNLFAHDSQFRMGILVIVPVTVLYLLLILFVYNAPILDPFTPRGRETFTGTLLLYLAVGFYPGYLKSALTYSGQAEAGWIIRVSPADPILILRAARRFILVFFIAPYLALLTAMYIAFTGAVAHVVQHFALISLLIVIETDFMLLFFPQIPFSRPVTTGRRSGGAFLRLFSGAIVLLPIFLLVYFVYPVAAAYWASLAGLVILMFVVRFLGGRRAARKLSSEEFAL